MADVARQREGEGATCLFQCVAWLWIELHRICDEVFQPLEDAVTEAYDK